jgi:hypothetical protein
MTVFLIDWFVQHAMYSLFVKSIQFSCSLMVIPRYYNHGISIVMRRLEDFYH